MGDLSLFQILVGAVVSVVVAAIGGGTIGQILQARTSRHLGVQQHDIEVETNALAGFRDLVASLRDEVARLREDRDEDRQRIERAEKRIGVAEDQIKVERDLRWTAIQHIRTLYAWITQHIPAGAQPPDVPEDLAPHVIVPRKDTP